MRIMLLDGGRSWRGGQRQVLLLARGLHERAIPIQVLAPHGSGLASTSHCEGIPVVPWTPRNDLDLLAAARLALLARRFGASVIHAHDGKAVAMARLAQWLGLTAPLIVTRGVTSAPRRRIKYHRGVARYLAVSTAVRQQLLDAGIRSDIVEVVSCGVESPAANEPTTDRERLGVSSTERVVLAAGALTREKGWHTVIRAAVLSARRQMGVRWLIAGDGPLRGELERLAGVLAAPVQFLGWVESIGPYLNAAEVLVHTPDAEGFGMVAVEALARGIPVVASAVGGLPEIIPEPSVGTLVAPQNPAAVTDALQSWLADPTRLSAVRYHGPLTAARFNVPSMVEGTMRIYRQVLHQTSPVLSTVRSRQMPSPPAAVGS